MYAISVQTKRGPTSIRIAYYMGKFRLDSVDELAPRMPEFDSPIKMLEYYTAYKNRPMYQQREVWVDFTGHNYSKIHLREPLLKEVRSLSHIARLAVHKAGVRLAEEREKLPHVMKNYLNEYPYTL